MIQPPTYDFAKDKFCNYCGTPFAEQKIYPRKCFRCSNDTYKNPIPIVVAMVPVFTMPDSQCGWLIQQRNIQPKKGGWAFPGGYIDLGESWQQAAVRELQEEVGLITKPEDFVLYEVVNAANGNMLIFGIHVEGVKEEDIHFVPNEEVSNIQLITDPYKIELCFPTHNEQLRNYYDSLDW